MRTRPSRRFARFLLLLASLSFALLLGEFLARWQVEGSFLEAVDSVLGVRTAESSSERAAVVPDDELGFVLGPSVENLNSRGTRHAEFVQPKPAGLFRVVLLGDSVGFPLDGFFAVVERRSRAVSAGELDFVNACVFGYTTWQERRFLERDLLDVEPDLVVLQYCVNDNYRMLHRLTSKGTRLLTPEAQEYLFPEGTSPGSWLSRNSYLVYCVRKLVFGMASEKQKVWEHVGKAAWTDASWDEAEQHLAAMRDAVRARGGEFVVVAVPHEDQLDVAASGRDAAFVEKPQRELAARCRALGIRLLDLLPALREHADEPLYTDRLHLSPAGHQLVGDALGDYLVAERLVPVR